MSSFNDGKSKVQVRPSTFLLRAKSSYIIPLNECMSSFYNLNLLCDRNKTRTLIRDSHIHTHIIYWTRCWVYKYGSYAASDSLKFYFHVSVERVIRTLQLIIALYQVRISIFMVYTHTYSKAYTHNYVKPINSKNFSYSMWRTFSYPRKS